MNQARIQAKIWKTNGRSATVLGAPYEFYRQTAQIELEDGSGGIELEDGSGTIELDGIAWTFPGPALFSRFVALNAEDMNFRKPNKYGKPTWYALLDGTGLKTGDYFVGQQGTFFIAGLQPLLPILVVECNRVVKISRAELPSGVGANSYSGIMPSTETVIASNVPCSILQGTKGEKSDASLPGDTRSPWWNVLLPGTLPQIMVGDLLSDDLGQTYVVSSPEKTDLGWRVVCMMTEV